MARCAGCSAPVCETCDFKFPGGYHYCPDCATNPLQPMSGWRKGLAVWSMVLATWVTLFFVVLLSGALAEFVTDQIGAIIVGALIMLPGMLGFGFACGSLDSRAGNPPIVWVAVIWNGILMAAWILLTVIGLMAQGRL